MTALLAPEANAVRSPPPADPAAVVRRWPAAFSLIEPLPVGMRSYATLEALADRIALLLQGRGFDLVPGAAALPGLDTFPKVTVMAAGRTRAEAEWLGAAVLLSPGGVRADLDLLHDALDAAIRRRGQ